MLCRHPATSQLGAYPPGVPLPPAYCVRRSEPVYARRVLAAAADLGDVPRLPAVLAAILVAVPLDLTLTTSVGATSRFLSHYCLPQSDDFLKPSVSSIRTFRRERFARHRLVR
jgi:hypothetical protein